MAKRNFLAEIGDVKALSSDTSSGSSVTTSTKPLPGAAESVAPAARRSVVAPSRVGRKALTVHVDEEVRVQLKVLAAQERTTVESLMHEAIGLMFEQRETSKSQR